MKKHPFEPFILKNSKSMIIGTLPPENIDYYYSNSANTRMWDLLKSIKDNNKVEKNAYLLSKEEKQNILKDLNLSMTDIVLEYTRKKETTKDIDIEPIKFQNIVKLIENTSIENLLFVYKKALIYFLKSINFDFNAENIKEYGKVLEIQLNNKKINCILLPNPLSRGKKGETLEFKKEIYKKYIVI